MGSRLRGNDGTVCGVTVSARAARNVRHGRLQGRLGMGSRLRGNDGRGCEASLFPLVPRGMSVTGVSRGDWGWVPAFAGMTGGCVASLFPLVPRGMSVTGVSRGDGGWVPALGVWRHCFRSCRAECLSTGDGFPPSRERRKGCGVTVSARAARNVCVAGMTEGGVGTCRAGSWVPAFAGMTEGCDASLFPARAARNVRHGRLPGRRGMGSRLRGNDGRGCDASLFPLVPRGMSVTGVSRGDGGWVPAFAGMTVGWERSPPSPQPSPARGEGVRGSFSRVGSYGATSSCRSHRGGEVGELPRSGTARPPSPR